MNWKQHYEKQNAAVYVMPADYTPQDKVAEQLGCPPDRVNERLRPSIKAKQIDVKSFSVWDRSMKRIVRVFGYKVLNEKPAKKP